MGALADAGRPRRAYHRLVVALFNIVSPFQVPILSKYLKLGIAIGALEGFVYPAAQRDDS